MVEGSRRAGLKVMTNGVRSDGLAVSCRGLSVSLRGMQRTRSDFVFQVTAVISSLDQLSYEFL